MFAKMDQVFSLKHRFRTRPYDGAWVERKHAAIAEKTHLLTLNYLFFNNASALNTLKKLLLDYGYNYLTLPYHGVNGPGNLFIGSGGRISSETFSEGGRAIDLVAAYDAIYEGLSREERSYIEYNLLRPLYVTLKKHNAKQSNWQSWHNAGMTGIGAVLNDKSMVEYAIDGKTNGFKYQMSESVQDDGTWYEGSLSYHFGALEALQTTV